MAISGRGPIDEAGAHIFVSLLGKHGLTARAISTDAFSTELEAEAVQLVCLCFVGAENTRAQVRFGLRRLRRRLPEARLLACFWGSQDGELDELCSITEGGACVGSLGDALNFSIDVARHSLQPFNASNTAAE